MAEPTAADSVPSASESPAAPSTASGPDSKQQAAAEFDAGVEYFNDAEYEAAARAFLRADVLAPNSEAVANAIAAAERANDHLLVVEAAERGLSRKSTDPGLAAEARRALSQAAKHLARLDLSCKPSPCDLFIDGAPTEPGPRYLLPGTHRLTATASEDQRVEQSERLVAGTTYRVVLHPTATDDAAADVTSQPHPEEQPAEHMPAEERPEGELPPDAAPRAASGGASPAWFYVSGGVTLALAGTWAWSGLDTLSANDKAPDTVPSNQQLPRAELRDKALRTDLLLGGTVIMAGLTTYLGIAVVDWSGGESQTAVVPLEGGAGVMTTGRF